MGFTLRDVLDISHLQQLLGSFYPIAGVALAIKDREENIVAEIGWQDICKKFHQQCHLTRQKCQQSDNTIIKHLYDKEACIGYQCPNGLRDCAAPILIGNRHLGTVYAGQFFHQPPDENFFRQQARNYEFDEIEYLQALNRVPIITETRINQIMDFIVHLAELLTRMGMERIQQMKAADIVIREQRYLNEAILDTAGNLIMVCDRKGRIIRFNQACEQITGYTFDEVKGSYIWRMIYNQEDKERVKDLFSNTGTYWSSPGLRHKLENTWLIRDGKHRLISWIFTFLVNDEGLAEYAIGTGTDVTRQRIMEDRLRESEQELRSILENASAIIYALSLDGRFRFVSRGWTVQLGHKINEVDNHSYKDFVHPDDVPALSDYLNKVITTGRWQETVAYRIRHKKGTWHWHISTVSPVKDKTDNPLFMVGVATDITERKMAEDAMYESERRLRELLENVKLAAVVVDTSGDIIFCNDFLLELCDWKREEVTGEKWFKTFVAPEYQERDEEIINWSLNHKIAPAHSESEILTRSGQRRTIMWSNTLLLDIKGTPTGFAAIGEDVTERHISEAKERKLVLDLELANKELKEFAYIVSHDLKAPLRAIRSLADWIYSDNIDNLNKDGKEQLELLVSRVSRMQNLLEGILKYSRLSSRKEQNSLISIEEIIREVEEMLAPPDHIKIIIQDKMPELILDRTRIEQIFENLISNAIKYMDKPYGLITITCEQQGPFWQFTVSDNGPGIEERYFDKIFIIFQTLKARDEFESTGIGLTIVKKIIEMYGGEIWVRSVVGEGSAFYFTLPASADLLEEDS